MSGPSAQLVARNLRGFQQAMKAADAATRKAGETAVKVEAFRLAGVLKRELKAGAPGGRGVAPLRVISRGTRNRKPLARLAPAVRYWSTRTPTGLAASVGFGGAGKAATSAAWLRIAARLQEGYVTPAGAPRAHGTLRQYFVRIGASMGKGSRLRRYYFLRKATGALTTPARPIIAPFWAAHRSETERNIVSNFNRKMRGERI